MDAKKKLKKIYAKDDEQTALKSGGEWTKRVNVDFPIWAIKDLDREASRKGITRQSLIKTWVIDKIDSLKTTSVNKAV